MGFRNFIKKVAQTVSSAVSSVAKAVTNVVTAIVKNPLPTIETIALSAIGVPPPLASAIVTGMNGGTPDQMLKASIASSVPSMGSSVSSALNVSPVVGNAVASTAVQVALGTPIENALTNTVASLAVSNVAPTVSKQVTEIVSDPTIAKAVTNAALNTSAAIIQGGSSDAITNALTNSLTNSVIKSGIELTKDAFAPSVTPTTNPDVYNAAKDTGLVTQPVIEPVKSPLDTVFQPDYSLSSVAKPSAPEIKAPLSQVADTVGTTPADYSLTPPTTKLELAPPSTPSFTEAPVLAPLPTEIKAPLSQVAENVGITPVDYSLTTPTTGLGLSQPTTPNLSDMDEGKGLTTQVPSGTVGQEGITLPSGLSTIPETSDILKPDYSLPSSLTVKETPVDYSATSPVTVGETPVDYSLSGLSTIPAVSETPVDYSLSTPVNVTQPPIGSLDNLSTTSKVGETPVDYSLSAPSGLGIQASLAETPITVGETPVDYSLNVNTTSTPELELPTMPGLKDMGGGQGLTVPVEGGTVGGLGFTPTDASVVLGDPKSFINDPNVLGKPVMQVDPAYLESTTAPKTSTYSLDGQATPMARRRALGLAFGESDIPWLDTRAQMLRPIEISDIISPTGYAGGLSGAMTQKVKPVSSIIPQDLPGIEPELMDVIKDREYDMLYAQGGAVQNFADGSSALTYCSASKFMDQFTPKFYPVKCNLLQSSGAKKAAIALAQLQQLRPSIAGGYNTMAKGGLPSKYKEAAPDGHHPEFITGLTGYYAGGRGTGQSDDIPAMLHDGDYVIDAEAVSAFGDGSSKAGNEVLMKFMHQVPHPKTDGGQPVPAKIADGEVVLPSSFVTALGGGDNKRGARMLDEMRERLRQHKRSAPDTKIPPKAKSPLEYLRGVKG